MRESERIKHSIEKKDLGNGILVDKELYLECQTWSAECGYDDPMAFARACVMLGIEEFMKEHKSRLSGSKAQGS